MAAIAIFLGLAMADVRRHVSFITVRWSHTRSENFYFGRCSTSRVEEGRQELGR